MAKKLSPEVLEALKDYEYKIYGHDIFIYKFNNTSADEAVLPEGVVELMPQAFMDMTNLKKVTLPESLRIIGHHSFGNCTGLTEIVIPKSVTHIWEYAFYGCKNLKDISIQGKKISICEGTFEGTAYIDDPKNWEDGILYVGNHLIKADGTVGGKYAIKNSVKSIAWRAFRECAGLTEVTVPKSVTMICRGAFEDCVNITKISLPYINSGFASMGFGHFFAASLMFYNEKIVPPALKEVTFTKGRKIGKELFRNCQHITKITLADSFTVIEECAFDYCTSLAEITLGKNLKQIGFGAFLYCTSLKKINFGGTYEEWKKIFKDNCWDNGTPDYVVCCRDCTVKKGE